MIVVADASVLINLSKITKLDLLKSFFGKVFISSGVYDEVVNRGEGKFGSYEVKNASWIIIKEAKDTLAINLLIADLDLGETETLVLAEELKADLVLVDEVHARRKAEICGFKVKGTIGLLVNGYKKGLIKDIKSLLDELIAKKTWISEEVYSRVLKEINFK